MRAERDSVTSGLTDTGFQYLTRLPGLGDLHASVYSQLQTARLLVPFVGKVEGSRSADGGGENYVCERGVCTLVEHLLQVAGVQPSCGRQAKTIALAPSIGHASARWRVEHEHGAELFDAVMLTQPVPQQLELLDGSEPGVWLTESKIIANLRAVQYSSRYALSLFFSEEHRQELDLLLPYVAKYVRKDEDDRLVFISYDSAKRQASGAPSILVHSSVPYGIRSMKAAVPYATVEAELLESLLRLLPGLPQARTVRLFPWVYSQVRFPLDMGNNVASILVEPTLKNWKVPPLVLCGDAFSPLGSRFDGCVQSGEHAASAVIDALRTWPGVSSTSK